MNTTDFLETAKDLAYKSGTIMRENFHAHMKKEWKEDNTPVTQTDLDINALILHELGHAYPDHSILSEEGDDFSPEDAYVWICDPVDGTHNFAHGVPTATFALTLTHIGTPIVSVIYDPFLDRLFYAEKHKGAYLNGTQIHVSSVPTLNHTVIGMGKMNTVRNLFPVYESLHNHGSRIISGLSIHYMTALVAAGELSAAFFGGTAPHDITAGKLLVEEAGGSCTDIMGSIPERFDRDMEGQLCTNGILHETILDIMNRVSPRNSK